MNRWQLKSVGVIEAELFLMREDYRLNKRLLEAYFDVVVELTEKHNISFRGPDGEMLFKAELNHQKYYSTADFQELCRLCFDFRNMGSERPELDYEVRQIPRISRVHRQGTRRIF
jgi:hypothetical protein